MARDCSSCGRSFDTLSALRLHQPECDEADARVDVSDASVDAVAEQAVAELLTCDRCEQSNDAADDLERDTTGDVLALIARFTCQHCGATNENTAVLDSAGGRDA